MASVRNCNLPSELHYNVESNVWARPEADGTVTIGMTAYACALTGEVVACTPMRVGRQIESNRSAATVESGKWVGPVKAPLAGQIVAVNEEVSKNPALINADPYGRGWLLKLQPANWPEDARRLVTGDAVAAAFEKRMAADGFAGCP